MRYDLGSLLRLVIWTVRAPREAARIVAAERYPRDVMWMVLVLVCILSVLMQAALQTILPLPSNPDATQITPMVYTLIILSSLVMLIFVLYFIGLAIEGQGTFPGTIAAVCWAQFLLLVAQPIQALALLVSPAAAEIVYLVVLFVALRALVHLMREVHKFESLWKSVATVTLSILGIGFGFVVILQITRAAASGGLS